MSPSPISFAAFNRTDSILVNNFLFESNCSRSSFQQNYGASQLYENIRLVFCLSKNKIRIPIEKLVEFISYDRPRRFSRYALSTRFCLKRTAREIVNHEALPIVAQLEWTFCFCASRPSFKNFHDIKGETPSNV